MISILNINTSIYIIVTSVLMGILMSLPYYGTICFRDKGIVILSSYVFAGLSAVYAYQTENIYLILYGLLSISYAFLIKESNAESNTTSAFPTLIVISMCLVVTPEIGKIFLLPCMLFTFSALSVCVKDVYAKSRFPPPPSWAGSV